MREPDVLYADFFKHVGLCINVWANIEADLFAICTAILKISEHFSAIVFYRTPTIDSRLALTNDLVAAWQEPNGRQSGGHPPPLLREWSDLKSELSDLLQFRNSLAHHPVHYGGGTAQVELAENGFVERYFVEESFITMARAPGDVLRGKTQSEITLPAMTAYLAKVETVRSRLRRFRIDVKQAMQPVA